MTAPSHPINQIAPDLASIEARKGLFEYCELGRDQSFRATPARRPTRRSSMPMRVCTEHRG